MTPQCANTPGGAIGPGPSRPRRQWGELFNGKARFAAFTHQQWVEWVRTHASVEWADWLAYVEDRYDLGPDPEIR